MKNQNFNRPDYIHFNKRLKFFITQSLMNQTKTLKRYGSLLPNLDLACANHNSYFISKVKYFTIVTRR